MRTTITVDDTSFGEWGLQWNDLQILASLITTPGTLLWTGDKRFADTAAQFGVRYGPE
jgi:hypothetical protein